MLLHAAQDQQWNGRVGTKQQQQQQQQQQQKTSLIPRCQVFCHGSSILECEPDCPSVDMFKLLDVLLGGWVPGTVCILQDGSDHGVVGSSSDSDAGVSH